MKSSPSPQLGRLLSGDQLAALCECLGPPMRSLLTIEDSDGKCLAGKPVVVTAVTREVHCDGRTIGRVVATGAGAEAAAVALATAVEIAASHAWAAERARLQRSSVRANSVEPADRARTSFLAMMSHELRTPLTSVMGYAEILLEGLAGPITSEQADHLRTILVKADQLLGVLGSVLDVANASSTGITDRSVVSLPPLISEVVSSYAEDVSRRQLQVLVEASALAAFGDRRQLRQVIAQLVGNAVKFSRDGGLIEITVRPGPMAVDSNEIVDGAHVVVRDHGIGISAEAMTQVFEPFFQADSSSTRAHGGAGIGLTVARAFVEAHGGTIWVDSTAGEGATFVAALPLATEADKLAEIARFTESSE